MERLHLAWPRWHGAEDGRCDRVNNRVENRGDWQNSDDGAYASNVIVPAHGICKEGPLVFPLEKRQEQQRCQVSMSIGAMMPPPA